MIIFIFFPLFIAFILVLFSKSFLLFHSVSLFLLSLFCISVINHFYSFFIIHSFSSYLFFLFFSNSITPSFKFFFFQHISFILSFSHVVCLYSPLTLLLPYVFPVFFSILVSFLYFSILSFHYFLFHIFSFKIFSSFSTLLLFAYTNWEIICKLTLTNRN